MRFPPHRLPPPALLLGALLTAGAAPKPVLFVTIPPQRWLLRSLAGEAVEVELLVAPGQNPHTFEPTGRQLARLARAQGWLTIGLPFERTLLAKARASRPGLAEYPVHAGVPRLGAPPHGHEHTEHTDAHTSAADDPCCAPEGADPHIWLAPRPMAQLATNTCRALQQILPDARERLGAALAELTVSLARLERELAATLAPAAGRTFWVYHPSWAYFAEAFNLRQQAVEQEGREPSGRQLARLIESARAARARVLFADPQFDPGPIRTLARQLDARVVTLDPLAEAWPDNLRHVAAVLWEALQEPADDRNS